MPGAGVRARAEGGTPSGPGGGYPLMTICRASKANGEPCTLAATGPQGLCWAHDPANREKRSRMASRAARSKPNRELSSIKTLLEDLTERVLSGELPTGQAAVANQLINTRLRTIEQERKMRELEEIAERLEALEGVLKGRKAR
jgi:hypothetical protein